MQGENVVQLKTKDEFSAGEKFQSLSALSMLAASRSLAEGAVLHFVFMRTIYWGKKTEYISYRHFLEGVWDGGREEWVVAGLAMGRTTLSLSINALIRDGILEREIRGGSGGYPYYTLNIGQGFEMLKQPKNKKPTGNGLKTPRPKAEPPPSEIRTPLTMRKNKQENTSSERSSTRSRADNVEHLLSDEDAMVVLADNMRYRANKAKRARQSKLEKARARETKADLEFVWAEACREAHPDMKHTAWTGKERGQVSAFKMAFRSEHRKVRVSDFLEFAAANWNRIMAAQFSFMTDKPPPQYPDFGFVMKFKRYFVAAFADKEFDTRQVVLTAKEREIRKNMKRGMTREQAEEAYASGEKQQGVVGKLVDEAETANMEKRALARKVEELERDRQDLVLREGRRIQEEKKAARKKALRSGRDEDEDLNPGSKAPKRNVKRDAEGFEEFVWDDK